MLHKFLILIKDSESPSLFIVNAEDEKEAMNDFAYFYAMRDEMFLENLSEKAVNAGFAEHFWLKTQEEQDHFMMNNAEILTTEDIFKERVFDYFNDQPAFAYFYLNYYFNDIGHFPKEMIVYIWKKEVTEGDWCEVQVININSIEVIGINPK